MIYKLKVIYLLIFVFLFYNCNRSNNSDLVKEENMENEEIEFTYRAPFACYSLKVFSFDDQILKIIKCERDTMRGVWRIKILAL